MQTDELINYIKNPALLNRQSVSDLKKLVTDFPYFQTAHLLLSMSAKKWDASIYQQSLKKTAIVATNRKHLFQLISNLENNFKVEEEKTDTTQAIKVNNNDNKIEAATTPETKMQVATISQTTIAAPEIKHEEINVSTKKLLNPEEILEKEIENNVVISFVEKEILKTTQLHQTTLSEEKPTNFSDWLIFLKKNNGQSYQKIEDKVNDQKEKNLTLKNKTATIKVNQEENFVSKKEKNKALIDKIIDTNPGLIKNKEELKFYTPDTKAKESLIENEHLVTETLAKIYAMQGSVNKAVRAYEILSLKFPQKSAYFASLIQKLKNNQ